MKKVTEKTLRSFRQALGVMIRERREVKQISQAKLAEMIGSTQNRMPEIERGDTKNIDTYITCITVLGGQLSITWK
jgi:transcriptional regulator with XRE-family HTH domain